MVDPLRLTAEQARVFSALEAARDPFEFARILGVRLNPAQRRMFTLVGTNPDGWSWRLQAVLHVSANQIGKTLGLAILLLWAAWNKIGIDTADGVRWMRAPYAWFHLAPTQQQAYLVLNDMVLLMKGDHSAQKDECLLPQGLIHEIKVEQYYNGLEFWNGAIVQFRTTDDQAKALQGRRAAGISYDEAAFEPHLNSVINETLMMRLIASRGPLWLVSTPDGINDWYEIVIAAQEASFPQRIAEAGDPLAGGSCQIGDLIPLWETPDGVGLVWSTIEDNVGYGITAEDRDRMERTIDAATKEQQLRGAFLEPREAFFVPSSQVDKAFVSRLPASEDPQPDHLYVISWDPADANDPTAMVVLDVTKKPWRAVHMGYWLRPMGEPRLLDAIYSTHARWNGGATNRIRGQRPPRAITVWDSTSMGGSMLTHSLAGLTPHFAMNLAGPNTKINALTDLRMALNSGALVIPTMGEWAGWRREVLTYKLPDDRIKQDRVMTLLGAVHVAAKGLISTPVSNFRFHGRQ